MKQLSQQNLKMHLFINKIFLFLNLFIKFEGKFYADMRKNLSY